MVTSKKATNAEILKQVIYEMLALAYLVELLSKNKCFRGQSSIDSNEVLQSAIAVKFRILYDFLFRKKAESNGDGPSDMFSAQDDFKTVIKKPAFTGLDPNGMFTSESVSKYLVHFTQERISKPKELPQPKFKGGNENYFRNSSLLLASAEKFIDALTKSNFMNFNQESENYLKDFKNVIERLKEIPEFKANYK